MIGKGEGVKQSKGQTSEGSVQDARGAGNVVGNIMRSDGVEMRYGMMV